MFAAIISRALFYYAFHAGAADPEDVAQDVVVHLLRRSHLVKSNMTAYLRVAIHNEMCRKWRRKDGKMPPLSLDFGRVGTPDPQYEGIEHTDFDRLMAEYPDLVNWLIDYSEVRGHGMMDRVRAHRRRRKLQEVLAT